MLEIPSGNKVVVSLDEAGRGPLFGSVFVGAVIMPSSYENDDKYVGMINDSKKLSIKKRKELARYIEKVAIAYAVGIATAEEIDKHNILNATMLAMHRALDDVYRKCPFEKIEVDGNYFKPYLPPGNDTLWLEHECVIDGDALKLGLASASILAKVYHDDWIDKICDENPEFVEKYNLRKCKGYGTKAHMDGLKTYGPTVYHRKTFAPVQAALKSNS